MSGIGGVFRRDKAPVADGEIQAMAATLAHRGPDGTNSLTSSGIGLFHCQLIDTPESTFERLPGKTLSGNIFITWHGRLDSRKELAHKTGWRRPLDQTPDSDLILAAYDTWGEGLVAHIIGDFAFAIWDESNQKMVCVRDHMGIKPFYYMLSEKCFAFASEIKALFALPECRRVINEERIADYLTCIVTDKDSTFYKHIFRLPPGHSLVVDHSHSKLQCYWQPHPAKIEGKDGRDYQEQFYSIFHNAVKSRLRSKTAVGTFLSGGLDSSSIACMAAGPLKQDLPGELHSFSGIFDTVSECDEREYFHTVLQRYPIRAHYIHADTINPWEAYEEAFQNEDEPFWAPHFFMMRELLALARRNGIKVMLDGHDGDSAVSYGTGLFTDLFRQGRWLRLIHLCHTAEQTPTYGKTLKRFLATAKNSTFSILNTAFPHYKRTDAITQRIDRLHPEFAEKSKVKYRLIEFEKTKAKKGQPEKEIHLRKLHAPIHPLALEFLERQCTRQQAVGRYPFFDKHLIEFCLALPSEEKFVNGYNRYIARASLRFFVPQEIHLRKGKTDFSPNMRHVFSVSNQGARQIHVDRLCEPVYSYINKNKYEKFSSIFASKPDEASLLELGFLLRGIALAEWVQNE